MLPADKGALQERIERWLSALPIDPLGVEERDRTAFAALFNSIYQRKIEWGYCDWRFLQPESHSKAFVCRDDAGLKGVGGYQLTRLIGASEVVGALYADVMVRPEQQGTGLIFLALDRAVEASARAAGARVSYLFPNPRGATAWLARNGWAALDSRITYIGPCRGGAEASTIHGVDRFDDWVDTIAVGFARSHPTLSAAKRDARYLNWRFTAHPSHRYSFFVCALHDRPVAYMVLKVFRDPIGGPAVGDIVDILWAEDDIPMLAGMLRFAMSYFSDHAVSHANMWLRTNTVLDELALELGFTQSDQTRHFLCKVLDPAYKWLADSRRWYLTMADSEIY